MQNFPDLRPLIKPEHGRKSRPLTERALSPTENKLVSFFTPFKGDWVSVSVTTLAEHCCVSKSAVYEAVRRLSKRGMLESVAQYENTTQIENRYRLKTLPTQS